MRLRSSRAAIYAGAAAVVLMMPVVPAMVGAKTTYEQQQSTKVEAVVKQASYTENVLDLVASDYVKYEETDMYADMAIAIADPYVEVYAGADGTSEVVGRLYQNGIASVAEMGLDWTRIDSGSVSGYVETCALCFGEEAADIGNGIAEVTAEITAQAAPVFASADAQESIQAVDEGAVYSAVSKCDGYVAIIVDDAKVYVSEDDITLHYGLSEGYTNEEAIAKEEAEEAERIAAEEARKQAEAEAAAAEAARIQAAMSSVEVSYNPTMEVSDDEVWLLACLIDWEAGWESYEGKLAVANVVLNRVRSPYYGNSIGSVIYARSQFSGVSDGSGNPSQRFASRLASGPRTQECIEAAMEALSGVNNIGSYTSFRALYAANYAAYVSYTIIGNHCFF